MVYTWEFSISNNKFAANLDMIHPVYRKSAMVSEHYLFMIIGIDADDRTFSLSVITDRDIADELRVHEN